MADMQFLLLNDRWALAYDNLQWILQRRGSYDRRRKKYNWHGVSYVATRRDILMRVIRENGVEPDADAMQALADLPGTFREWLAGQTGAASRFKGCDSAMSEVARPKDVDAA